MSEMEDFRKDLLDLAESLEKLGDAISRAEMERVKDRDDLLRILERVIEVQGHNYKILSEQIEDLKQ